MSTGRNKEIARPGEDGRITTTPGGGMKISLEGGPVRVSFSGGGVAYLLVDTSTSMEGRELEEAKEGALKFAADAQAQGYAVGLVEFYSQAVHLCDPQRDLSKLRCYIREMEAGGTTDMAGAITVATGKLRDMSGTRAIVIATDGEPNSRTDALAAAWKAKQNGIDVLTIGTTLADADFLKKIASRTDLAVVVASGQLGQGIASAAKMLPSANS